MQFYRERSWGSVVDFEVIVEKLWTCAAFEKLPQAKHAYGPVTPTSRFCSSFVFNAFGDVARWLWNEIRFLDWPSAHRPNIGTSGAYRSNVENSVTWLSQKFSIDCVIHMHYN
jgi:hypothetical protein